MFHSLVSLFWWFPVEAKGMVGSKLVESKLHV